MSEPSGPALEVDVEGASPAADPAPADESRAAEILNAGSAELRTPSGGLAPGVRRFVALLRRPEDLAGALECIYTAHMLKRRHGADMRATALAPAALAELMRGADCFDEIQAYSPSESLRAQIVRAAPHVLYLPDGDDRAHIASWFSGARVRLGGSRSRILSALLPAHRLHEERDLERLGKRGYDLYPELADFGMRAPAADLPDLQGAVWLSLFDDHDLTGGWPVGHAGRLARLLEKVGLSLAIPLPPAGHVAAPALARILRDAAYLQKQSSNLLLVKDCGPAERAAGMARAKIVVGPAGPETLLAALLKRQVVALHDMKTVRREARPRARDDVREFGGGLIARLAAREAALSSHYVRLANSFERRLAPVVDECINVCQACGYASCVEYISPERVFEQVKKALLPF